MDHRGFVSISWRSPVDLYDQSENDTVTVPDWTETPGYCGAIVVMASDPDLESSHNGNLCNALRAPSHRKERARTGLGDNRVEGLTCVAQAALRVSDFCYAPRMQ